MLTFKRPYTASKEKEMTAKKIKNKEYYRKKNFYYFLAHLGIHTFQLDRQLSSISFDCSLTVGWQFALFPV